jgi:hypothetical protein
MRNGFKNSGFLLSPPHPLEDQLKDWNENQESLKNAMHRNIYGFHSVMKNEMEKLIVGSHTRLPCLPMSRISLDILKGRDDCIEFEDFLNVSCGFSTKNDIIDVHGSAEKYRLGFPNAL